MRTTLAVILAALLGGCAPAVIKAARKGTTQDMEKALGGSRPKQKHLDTGLCLAAARGETEAVRLLVENGADVEGEHLPGPFTRGKKACLTSCKGPRLPRGVSKAQGAIGSPTPLGCAALFGRKETAEFLLSRGADPQAARAISPQQPSPLELAAMHGEPGLVKVLLDRGADPHHVGKGQGLFMGSRTAYDWAVKLGHEESARILKDAMERSRPGALARRRTGSSGLKLFGQVMNLAGAFVPGLSQVGDIAGKVGTAVSVAEASQAVYNAARPAAPAPAGDSAPAAPQEPELHAAAERGDETKLKSLLDAGGDVDERCGGGETALMHAAAAGRHSATKFLLEAKAGVNARNQDGLTSLMVAVIARRPEFVESLLGAGAGANLQTRGGQTALDLAREAEQPRIVELLVKAGGKPGRSSREP